MPSPSPAAKLMTPDPSPPSGMSDDIASAFVARLAAGRMDEKDVTRVKIWLAADPAHRAAFARARGLWQGLSGIKSELRAVRPAPAPIRQRGWMLGAATGTAMAACLALFFLAGGSALLADHHTGTGEVTRVALPDGTIAWLDTKSALNVQYSKSERRVRLIAGRAWFDVRHNAARPFLVAAGGAILTDIGTAFAVNLSDGNHADVAVDRGVVRLDWLGRRTQLTAGQTISWGPDGSAVAPTPYEATAVPDWTRDRLTLDRQPLADALNEIARYRGGTILLLDAGARKRPVSGVLFLDRLDAGLDVLAANQGYRVVHLPYVAILLPRS